MLQFVWTKRYLSGSLIKLLELTWVIRDVVFLDSHVQLNVQVIGSIIDLWFDQIPYICLLALQSCLSWSLSLYSLMLWVICVFLKLLSWVMSFECQWITYIIECILVLSVLFLFVIIFLFRCFWCRFSHQRNWRNVLPKYVTFFLMQIWIGQREWMLLVLFWNLYKDLFGNITKIELFV